MIEYLSHWMVYYFRLMSDRFQKNGLVAWPEDLDPQENLLGRAPLQFEEFARETARMRNQ